MNLQDLLPHAMNYLQQADLRDVPGWQPRDPFIQSRDTLF